MRQIARHGQDRRYHHVRVGVNSRLDTIQAAILMPKLEILDEEIELRDEICRDYTMNFKASEHVKTPYVCDNLKSAWAQYTIMTPDRDRLIETLKYSHIPFAVHYPLMLAEQPAYFDKNVELPISREAASKVLSLPINSYLNRKDIKKIIKAIK